MFFSQSVSGRGWYFNTNGHDPGDAGYSSTNAGLESNPYRTIAQFNVIMGSGGAAVAGDIIYFCQGQTFYTSVPMNIQKSGTNTNHIVVTSYSPSSLLPNGFLRPRITCMLPLTFSPVTISGLSNIYVSNQTLSTTDSVTVVTKDNRLVAQGRFPNLGGEHGTIGGNTEGTGGYNRMNTPLSNNTVTLLEGVAIPSLLKASLPGSELVYRATRFTMERKRITAISGNLITFTDHHGNNSNQEPMDDWGYFIQGNVYTLNQNTEWFFDIRTSGSTSITTPKKVYVYSTTTPTGYEAATSNSLVNTNSNDYLEFREIKFDGANYDVMVMNDNTAGKHIVEDCLIEHAGRCGIRNKGTACQFLYDTIQQCGSKGFGITGGATNNLISDCYVREMGQLYGMMWGNLEADIGVFAAEANHDGIGVYSKMDGLTVLNSTFIKCGYSGIHFTYQDNITIRYNVADTTDNVLDDGGGIYVYGGTSPHGELNRIIAHNIVRNGIGAPDGRPSADISGNNVAGEGVSGIYFDRNTESVRCDSNVIFNYQKGIFGNYGTKTSQIRYNFIYACESDGLQLNRRDADVTSGNTITNNIVYIDSLPTPGVPNSKPNRIGIVLTHTTDASFAALANLGTINNNIYIRPMGSGPGNTEAEALFGKFSLNEALYGKGSWVSNSGYDANSTVFNTFTYGTLAEQNSKVIILVNDTYVNKTFTLSNKYDNQVGVHLTTGSVVVKPFESFIGFYTGPLDGIQLPPQLPPGTLKTQRNFIIKTK